MGVRETILRDMELVAELIGMPFKQRLSRIGVIAYELNEELQPGELVAIERLVADANRGTVRMDDSAEYN